MPEYTDNLKLFKYNTETDGKEVFSINEAMNHNWDILDKQPGTLKTNQITNCLTEVPQRIKVELNDSTFTLKAGSVVIVPYGTSAPTMEIGDTLNGGEIVDMSWDGSKLFYYVRYGEVTITNTGSGYQAFLNMSSTGVFSSCCVIHAYSGNSAPSGNNNMLWYDTTTNIVKRTSNSGTTWTNYYSLPFVVVTYGDHVVTSIDQVFNGFGFIGTMGWCDKGIKGLIANGRNVDGTLNNNEFIVDNIITYDFNVGSRYYLFERNQYILQARYAFVYIQNEQPNEEDFDASGTNAWFCPRDNYWRIYNNNTWEIRNVIPFTHVVAADSPPYVVNDGQFTTKQPLTIINEPTYYMNLSMPSARKINISKGNSGSIYTAPATGWFLFHQNTSGGKYCQFVNNNSGWVAFANSSNNYGQAIICPAQKGETVTLTYNTDGSLLNFIFIYAEGEI